MNTSHDLMSVGYLAERHQTTARVIGDAIHALEIPPTFSLNGLEYFDMPDEAEELVAAFVADRKENTRRHKSAAWTTEANISDASGGASAT